MIARIRLKHTRIYYQGRNKKTVFENRKEQLDLRKKIREKSSNNILKEYFKEIEKKQRK